MTDGQFAGRQVLADAQAMRVLRRLADVLRVAGYANDVIEGRSPRERAWSRMALGYPASVQDMGPADADALVSAGAADICPTSPDELVPRFTLFALGEVLVLVPKDGGFDPGRVYFGRDSLWLADFVTRLGLSGRAMADLGTGAGAVAALLAPHFDVVVATDILPRTAACAAITFALNARPGRLPAATACLSDVAGCLAPGTFSLVTGNPPWVPDLDRAVSGPARVYAEGGSTGFELPRKFIMEGAELLAPGGVMVILALDATWDTGEQPLRSLARGLLRLGFEAYVETTGISEHWKGTRDDPCARLPAIKSAEHVALIVRRRASSVPLRPAAPSRTVPFDRGTPSGRAGQTVPFGLGAPSGDRALSA
jgi:methylase of polypeptide subunit release factors